MVCYERTRAEFLLGEMMDVNKLIWERFHIKQGDNLPFTAWGGRGTRIRLAEVFAELGYTEGAEIGVRSGEYSYDILSRNPKLHLRCIDHWSRYARAKQIEQDEYMAKCIKTVAPYKGEVMKMTSMDALKLVPNGSLDFVYIDGHHEFDFVMQDIIGWSEKVRSGGIVSGHDYYAFYQSGIMYAVNAYTSAHNINQWYITKESEPSYFWVKK